MEHRFRYGVIGAGMQGCAAGYDLLVNGEGVEVSFFDRDRAVAEAAARRVNTLIGQERARGLAVDGQDEAGLARAFAGLSGVLSAVPYHLNPTVARASIAAGACFNDLGGNTAIVREELALDAAARAKGVSVVPDCGLAPGLGNTLAAWLIETMDDPVHVHIRCGGLPQSPRPPLGYKLVFNIGGLTNEYMGEAEFLRDGRLVRVPTLSEGEVISFPAPVGQAEAWVTSGGTSTAPATFAGRLQTYDYKTVRYPGHFDRIKTMADLGLLDTAPVVVRGQPVVPRELFHAVAGSKLSFPDDRDLVVMRVTCIGRHAGRAVRRTVDLLDFHDERTGFTAMERTTAFPAAAVLHFQVSKRVRPGATTPERDLPFDEYVDAVRARGLSLEETVVEGA